MEDKKKERKKYCDEQRGAILLIRQMGELTSLNEKLFTLPEIKMLLKWKKSEGKVNQEMRPCGCIHLTSRAPYPEDVVLQ